MHKSLTFILAIALPLASVAQTATETTVAAMIAGSDAAETVPDWGPIEAAGVDLADFLWIKRPVVVFADSPVDPLFVQQMRLLEAEPAVLVERDVVIITDTDPAARTSVRTRLRPRGFSLVLMEKDGEVKLRKPSPWDLREITRAIDKFPLRRQEMLEQRPAGR